MSTHLDGELGASGFVDTPLAYRIATRSDLLHNVVVLVYGIQFGGVEILHLSITTSQKMFKKKENKQQQQKKTPSQWRMLDAKLLERK